jgi:hypothetical protein
VLLSARNVERLRRLAAELQADGVQAVISQSRLWRRVSPVILL